MKDSVLKKYATAKPKDAATAPDAEGLDDLGSFGCLRGLHERAIGLELRRKDGSIVAFGYAWLSKCEFDPSGVITLHFGSETVKITGRNLNAELRPNVRLFSAIVRHRVPWIQEADGPTLIQSASTATVIEGIAVV